MAEPAFEARYPNIAVVCPRGAKKRVEKVVPVDLTYEAYDSDDVVRLAHLDGVAEGEGVMTVVDEIVSHHRVIDEAPEQTLRSVAAAL